MTDRPVVMAVASYRSRAAAHSDFHAVEEGARLSGSCHLALAVLEKGADGRLTIDRYFCSTAGPAWDGAVLGGALAVVAAPIGMTFLVAIAQSPAVLGGVAAIAEHFWNDIPKQQLRTMSDLIEARQAALLVVSADEIVASIQERLAGAAVVAIATMNVDLADKYLVGVEESETFG